MNTSNKDLLQRMMASYLYNGGNLALQWSTGVGKSRVAIKVIKDLFDRFENFSVLLVVAEEAHKENWKEEFKKALGESTYYKVMPHVQMICYASLTLSATLKDDVLVALTQCFGKFKVHKISLQNAIDSGFLPEPKIICIPLELERFSRTEVIEMDLTTTKIKKKGIITDFWSNRWKYLKHRKDYVGYVLQFSCTQKEKYEYINEQFEYWKRQFFRNQSNIRIKNMWLQWGSVRKRYLGELKTKKAYELCEKLKKQNKRFICFCSSILQAETLGKEDCIHSKKKDVSTIISEFNSGERNSIFAVGMLQEGQNLNNIQAGVIVQLDGEERGFIQKFGRSLRAEDPMQYILYYKDTRDEEYLQKALENINKDYIQEI